MLQQFKCGQKLGAIISNRIKTELKLPAQKSSKCLLCAEGMDVRCAYV